ncbi:hypothetical protein [Hafnia alvei]|uniref:Uncharacterized protein n=1 Tax=Hafnia alvei ATCC 51873 TaxID=1002364 RepID=G9Y2C0_HAFAL|nr:hypothetical protein [Hafnia alvei]EHM46865.1 hypothetical protein HMPREF0454_00732 [Hafnia alvei ATCC 51873]QQE44681.1 hypothetical protein I6H95_05060 [Hafnia alvei]
MGYYENALMALKQSRPHDVPEFEFKYRAAVSKLMTAEKLFRLMGPGEASLWNNIAPTLSHRADPDSFDTLFRTGAATYTPSWFSFDRPYLFGRQKTNVPDNREGQTMLMVIAINYELRHALIKKMIPDVNLQGMPEELKINSCRCKVEGGVITLGISLPVLKKISSHLTIEHLGGHINPIGVSIH